MSEQVQYQQHLNQPSSLPQCAKSTNDTHQSNMKQLASSKPVIPQITFSSQSSPRNPSFSSSQQQQPQMQQLPLSQSPDLKLPNTASETAQKTNETQSQSIALNQINKKMLIMNYIYDNSIDQLRKMKAKTLDLNFFESFKHVSLEERISPLILACHLGKLEIAKYLLINPNTSIDQGSEKNGYSALAIACMGGFYELAEFLIKRGANVNLKNNAGHPPLFQCFTRLTEDGNHFENKRLCFKLADLLLDHGARIDEIVVEQKGYTLLMTYCSVKELSNPRDINLNYSCIQYLLQNGADICRLSKKGKSIYEILEKHPNQDRITQLIKSTLSKRLVRTKEDSTAGQAGTRDQKTTQATQSSKTNIEYDSDCQIDGPSSSKNPTPCCRLFYFF